MILPHIKKKKILLKKAFSMKIIFQKTKTFQQTNSKGLPAKVTSHKRNSEVPRPPHL